MSDDLIKSELESIHQDDVPLVARRFKSAREAQGFSQVELLREAGYRNINKGLRRLRGLESGSAKAPDHRVIKRFGFTLGIDLDALCDELAHRRRKREEARRENAPPQPPRILGAMVQKARHQRGLSIPQLVEQLGAGPADRWEQRIEHLESGQFRLPKETELRKLAEPLGLSPDRLVQALRNEADQMQRHSELTRLTMLVSPLFARRYHQHYPGDRSILEFIEYAEEHAVEMECPASVYSEPFPVLYICSNGERHSYRDAIYPNL